MTHKVICDYCEKPIKDYSEDHWNLDIYEAGRASTRTDFDYHKKCALMILEAIKEMKE